MRLIATYSKWGNLYRGRFYINGKRVTERQHDDAVFASVIEGTFTKQVKEEGSGFGFNYRFIREIESV